LSDTPDNVTPFPAAAPAAAAEAPPDMGQCMGCGNAIDWRDLLPMVGGTKGHFVATSHDVGLGPRDSAARKGTMCGPVITRWTYLWVFTFRGSIQRTFVAMRRPVMRFQQIEAIEANILTEFSKVNPKTEAPVKRDGMTGAVLVGANGQADAPDVVLTISYQQISAE